jgi:hypothetical protein
MDISRYKELIELDKNNLLSNDQFWGELLDYEASVEFQITYNRKQEYLLLIEKYINQQIDFYEFKSLFLIMTKEDSEAASIILNDLKALETFKLDNDRLSLKISELITDISILCLDFSEPFAETEDEIAESKIKFYSLVKKHYLKLQKLFSVSSKKN